MQTKQFLGSCIVQTGPHKGILLRVAHGKGLLGRLRHPAHFFPLIKDRLIVIRIFLIALVSFPKNIVTRTESTLSLPSCEGMFRLLDTIHQGKGNNSHEEVKPCELSQNISCHVVHNYSFYYDV